MSIPHDHRRGEPKVVITIKFNRDSEHILEEVKDTLDANDRLVIFTADTKLEGTLILHIYEDDE
jgi:hypothetical protein